MISACSQSSRKGRKGRTVKTEICYREIPAEGSALAAGQAYVPVIVVSGDVQQNLVIGLIFTAVSLVRSYVLRRAFEALRVRQLSANSG